MRYILFLFFVVFSLSCGQTPATGNEIVFGDVIGSYDGRCATYDTNPQELENREDATLSVFAANLQEAGINDSCNKFEDFSLEVSSANATQISFIKILPSGFEARMTYFSASDSISLVQKRENGNIIFTGIKK